MTTNKKKNGWLRGLLKKAKGGVSHLAKKGISRFANYRFVPKSALSFDRERTLSKNITNLTKKRKKEDLERATSRAIDHAKRTYHIMTGKTMTPYEMRIEKMDPLLPKDTRQYLKNKYTEIDQRMNVYKQQRALKEKKFRKKHKVKKSLWDIFY